MAKMTGREAAEALISVNLPSLIGYTPEKAVRHYGADLLRTWYEQHYTRLAAESAAEARGDFRRR